ncbi:MAG: imidazole glycerol phosphate synthase subunit HisH [Lachnospiraceae bacterium]|jgi:glutamine amidotransferase|nr:imidazole glycerol phosphate synthase subunit HisH [Lachnospiraceae bacterium]
MIAILDYDAGNIKSVEKAIQYLGEQAVITRDKSVIERADGVILPGVGAFGDAMDKLRFYGLIPMITQIAASKTPFLGICLGLQLLFESSEESPGVAGLSLLKGNILRIPDTNDLKVPHIGWNALAFPKENTRGRLFAGIEDHAYVYFVHSYYLHAQEESIVKATTEYGVTVHACVEKDNIFACQFHPEKSSEVGLSILKNFIKIANEHKPT